jgi:predicted ester cyclase
MQSNLIEQDKKSVEKGNSELVVGFYEEATTRVRGDLVAKDFVGRAPGVTLDHDTFVKSLEQFTKAFGEGRYINEDTITEDDKVVTIGTFQGTHTGEFQGIPATGKKVSVMVVHVDRVRDGKIIEHLRISDTAGLLKQLAPSAASRIE